MPRFAGAAGERHPVGVRLRAISFDGEGIDLEGVLRLDGLTAIFGPNGAGKTRALEAAAGIVDPDQRPERDLRLGEPDVAFGRAFVELEDGDDWRWFAERLRAHHDDVDLTPEWPDAGSSLADAAVGATRLASRMAEVLLAGVPDQGVAVGDERVPARTAVSRLLERVLARPLVVVQNVEGRFVGLGWDPLAGDAEELRALAGSLVQVADGGVLELVLRRILDVGDEPRELATLVVQAGASPRPLAELIWVPAAAYDAGPEIDRAIDAVVGPDGWLREEDRAFRISPAVHGVLDEIVEEANAAAPSFVRTQGTVTAKVGDPQRWATGGARTIVGFRLGGETEIDVRALGSGTARWVHALVAEAARMVRARSRSGGGAGAARALVLVDEPELHLHPTAQADIARWLRSLADDGDSVLVATHSPAILSAADDPVGMVCSAGRPVLFSLGADLLGAADDLADQLGLDRGSWLQMVRAVLVVEGEHDRRIVRHFFGDRLDRLRVSVLALRGTDNAEALIDSDYLGEAGVPLLVMFDSVRESALRDAPVEELSAEEKKMRRLLEHTEHQRAAGHDVRAIAYEDPDVLCALPVEAVRREYPHARIDGWEPVVQAWQEAGRPGFKPFAIRTIGLKNVGADAFVEAVLRATREDDQPSPSLQAAFARVEAELGA